jgi:hypothetical protein
VPGGDRAFRGALQGRAEPAATRRAGAAAAAVSAEPPVR